MPAPQLAQNQVSIVPRIVDIVKYGRTSDFAGVIDHYVTKSEDSLKN
jgi:hypothetical protein